MTLPTLAQTAQALVGAGKGLLAIDESNGTCNARFAALGIGQTEAMRRSYRSMIVLTPGLCDSISGVILYDETIRQRTNDGRPPVDVLTAAGILPGIKVDTGAKPMAGHSGEKITEGLDGLRARLADYAAMGARFAKWRAVIAIGPDQPSRACIAANTHALARYAALSQEAGIVPVIETDVLMEGDHPLQRCRQVTEDTLHSLFDDLFVQGVMLEGAILKSNMVLPGVDCAVQDDVAAVAAATVATLRRVVPAAIAGIAFLSGGQGAELATTRLAAMNGLARAPDAHLPWPLAFSFARAIQQPALQIWQGRADRVTAAQDMLRHRAIANAAAMNGTFTPALEHA